MWERIQNFGSGIKGLRLTTKDSVLLFYIYALYEQSLEYFGIFCANCLDWVVCEQAMNAYSITVLPVHEMLGIHSVECILESSHIRGLLCSSKELSIVFIFNNFFYIQIASLDHNKLQLQYIIVIDEVNDNEMKSKLELNVYINKVIIIIINSIRYIQ